MKIFRHAAKLVITGLLALPLVATFAWPSLDSVEQRALAAAPSVPHSWSDARAWPAAAEAWVNDHFGWRSQMVAFNARLYHDLFGRFPTNQMMMGREGRIFLAAHNDRGRGEPYTALVACGWKFRREPEIVQQINGFIATFKAQGIAARLLIVPSGPVVYSEQMQPWQAERCRPDAVPLRRILASPALAPEARELVYFPLSEMRAMRDRVEFFPKTFFHWNASGAAAVAGLAEQRFWGRGANTTPIPLVQRMSPSDVGWLFPGIQHDSMTDDPNFGGTTISPCRGADCFPEAKTAMEKLGDVGRFLNSAPGLGPRLVVLADSFGNAGAPMFSRYHREVVYVSTNNMARLDPAEMAQLRKLLFVPGSGDEVLFLYHDATVLSDRIEYDLKNLSIQQQK
ncbi:hypothetical protein LK542_00670 [Massilia sp. IC2-477]|uniref:hypothetical protein n=1 Tax=Massilia sp. IC2-477 TaxID=2887198 RepID=UPI001D0FFD85|nr:hypothetical protein [Massilia sp. IC2-477]MCC2954123.1 hypothetical protein [Massilia sp. IC2-477]